MRRNLILALVPAFALAVACGDDADTGAFDTNPDSNGTSTSTSTSGEVPPDMPAAEAGTDSDDTSTTDPAGDGISPLDHSAKLFEQAHAETSSPGE